MLDERYETLIIMIILNGLLLFILGEKFLEDYKNGLLIFNKMQWCVLLGIVIGNILVFNHTRIKRKRGIE